MVKQLRAVRTREALIRAAAEVFAHNGYARASLPAISERAGVSAGALHFHFPNKEALADEVEDAAVRAVRELAEQCPRTGGGALETLVTVTHHLVAAVTTDPVTWAGFRLSGDPVRRRRAGLLEWWHVWVLDMMGQAREAGELADGVSPENAAVAVVAATVGFEALGSREREWLSPERMVQFWTFLLPGLAAACPPSLVQALNGVGVDPPKRRNGSVALVGTAHEADTTT
ncbi:ScbR family autoregulator-binding transcription factor [Streptomyces sp. NPDC005573]|uniref:ScbR family autoregulator-binding transcription factor n=1 Tax=Streptomyces sp. NPDC005573 TaxID=3156890 RepID=UPI0033B45C49